MDWPRISLVTASLNQGAFVEQTIRSVLDQGYPNLQYGIVDGGSTDGSLEIIERYRHQLDYVVIEPDEGQSQAINKGLARADGEIVGWLNSDDTLLAGALHRVGKFFYERGDANWLIGHSVQIDDRGAPGERIAPTGEFTLAGALLRSEPFNVPQPSTFWRSLLTDEAGLLDESLHHCMDFDLWCRFLAAGYRPTVIDTELATYRFHESSKTCGQEAGFIAALIDIERRYAQLLDWRQRLALRHRIGYQHRALAVRTLGRAVWRQALYRPWWFGSRQVIHCICRGEPTTDSAYHRAQAI